MWLQFLNCGVQVILLALVFFFWGVSSRRFGNGIGIDGSGQSGSSPILADIFYGLILIVALLFSHYFLPFF